MDPEIKAKWLTALRSGDFNQTKYLLKVLLHNKENDQEFCAYCCLGVLCEIAGFKSEKRGYTFNFNLNGILEDGIIPPMFGLTEADIRYLVEMNDKGDDTFDKIADWIEENL
jgi:hypothetical protein